MKRRLKRISDHSHKKFQKFCSERFVIMKATLSPVESRVMKFRSCSCCVISIRFCKILTMFCYCRHDGREGGEGIKSIFSAVAGRILNNEGIKPKSLISARVIKRTDGISWPHRSLHGNRKAKPSWPHLSDLIQIVFFIVQCYSSFAVAVPKSLSDVNWI